jgi:hypothetical protein
MSLKRTKTEFEKLQAFWDKKLRDSGFKDIESRDDRLHTWSTKLFSYHQSGAWEAKQAYYQMAENFLQEYKFDTNREKIIWEYHSTGISCRDIAKIFRKAKIKGLSKSMIFLVIKKLKMSMYAMYLSPKQEYHE